MLTDGHTDPRTHGRTDGRTDTPFYRDATAHLEIGKGRKKKKYIDCFLYRCHFPPTTATAFVTSTPLSSRDLHPSNVPVVVVVVVIVVVVVMGVVDTASLSPS